MHRSKILQDAEYLINNDREKDYKLNNSVYIKRIISMMKDYDLSMKAALS